MEQVLKVPDTEEEPGVDELTGTVGEWVEQRVGEQVQQEILNCPDKVEGQEEGELTETVGGWVELRVGE